LNKFNPQNQIFTHWQTLNIKYNTEVISGCYYDLNEEITWVQSVESCQTNSCAFNQNGINISQSSSNLITIDGVSGLMQNSTIDINGLTIDQFEYLGIIKSDINWPCRLGLGMTPDDSKSILNKLKSQKLLDSNVFSIYTYEGDTQSKMVFGGVDSNRYTTVFKWIKTIPGKSWNVELKNIIVDSTSINTKKIDISFLSNFNDFTFLPLQTAININENILHLDRFKNLFHNSIGWGIECAEISEKYPTITIEFNEFNIKFDPEEYFYKAIIDDKQYCVSSIFGISPESSFIPSIGNIMLRNHYIVFDFEDQRIGITKSNRKKNIPESLKPLLKIEEQNAIPGWLILEIILILAAISIFIYFILKLRFLKWSDNLIYLPRRRTRSQTIQIDLPGPFNFFTEEESKIVNFSPNDKTSNPNSPVRRKHTKPSTDDESIRSVKPKAPPNIPKKPSPENHTSSNLERVLQARNTNPPATFQFVDYKYNGRSERIVTDIFNSETASHFSDPEYRNDFDSEEELPVLHHLASGRRQSSQNEHALETLQESVEEL
jgi:hypothetical protein